MSTCSACHEVMHGLQTSSTSKYNVNLVRVHRPYNTVEPLYLGHIGTFILVLMVSSIQRLFDTLQYYTGTQNGVLIIEVFAIQKLVIGRFHCTYVRTYYNIKMLTCTTVID